MKHTRIISLTSLQDNFVHIVHDSKSAVVVDPSSAPPVLSLLESESLQLSHILITHHHADHTGGCLELKKKTGCLIAGPDDPRMPFVDTSDVSALPVPVEMIHTPGHTSSHVCYHISAPGSLFSGDTLFPGGCGRLFEGTAKQMWGSLLKLRSLPAETQIYPGHNYTLDNLEFCQSVLPGSRDIAERLQQCRKAGPLSHSALSEELATNVFLMCDDPAFTAQTGLSGFPTDIFAELRSRKDSW